MTPRLYFTHRRMLNRLSFDPQPTRNLTDPTTRQTMQTARAALGYLRELGYAEENAYGWFITDAGAIAAATNGVIHADGAGR